MIEVKTEVNPLCAKCRRDCKQGSHLKIVSCKLYDPVPAEDPRQLSLFETPPKGGKP